MLIDTEAEANLIRKDLLPAEHFKPSMRPLALLTASGSRMEGGQREVSLELTFGAKHLKGGGPKTWTTMAAFHDADIQVDAILSYPWLEEKHLGVFPHLKSLALLADRMLLLGSLNHPKHSSPKTRPEPDFDPDWERLVKVNYVRSLGLTLPAYGEGEEEPSFDDEETLEFIGGALEQSPDPTMWVRGIVMVPEGEEVKDEAVDALIQALHRDYDGEVLRDRVFPNPPARGPYGYGRIELKPGAVPKKGRAISLSGERREAMIALVEEWMRDGKVEDGQGPWSSPAFVVAKKGGKWRGVVDFRALNEATVADSHPLPRIEDILVRQGRKTLFSVMDLKDAFHQVPLHPDSRPLTCCSTPKGTKQWLCVVRLFATAKN